MNRTIQPGQRSGRVKIPASKSQAHRLLICAALGRGETLIQCDGLSADITATMACLNALAVRVVRARRALQSLSSTPRSADVCAKWSV